MTQAQIFADFMRAVWADAIVDEDDNSKYDQYANAADVATAMGAMPTGTRDGEWAQWQWPDGSIETLEANGNGVGGPVIG